MANDLERLAVLETTVREQSAQLESLGGAINMLESHAHNQELGLQAVAKDVEFMKRLQEQMATNSKARTQQLNTILGTVVAAAIAAVGSVVVALLK